jgi:hypothetical protein
MRPADDRNRPAAPAGLDDEPFVARLLEAAGPPPPSPELEIARIQEAARAEWRRRYAWPRRERAARRWRWVAAAAAALAIAMVLWRWAPGAGPAPRPRLAAVEAAAGEVTVALDGALRPLAVGAELAPGAVLRTGAGGHAALALAAGRSLRLAAGSELKLAAADRLELVRGALYLDSRGAPAAGAPRVVTAAGSFREVGTRFEVRVVDGAASVRLRVRDGVVRWRENGRTAEAAGGSELAIGADGSLERGAVEPWDPAWGWVLDAAPVPAADGWKLARLLAWYGRESGLEIVYADEATAALAAEVVVRGSIGRLGARDALAAALGSSGCVARVEPGGRLVVAAR